MLTQSDCKDLGIRTLKLVAKPQFLCCQKKTIKFETENFQSYTTIMENKL